MKLKNGQYVRHSRFGWGAVVECDSDQTMVFFRSVGVKKFETSAKNFAVVQDNTLEKKPRPGKRPSGTARKQISFASNK
ncbi:MAG TPA: hypothetical protein VFZ08_10480 [Terriglobia bacterium]|nr:hypothetical protein [Terriglobia bacterium]